MRINFADRDAQPTILYDTEAAGDAVVITVSASADQFWVLDWIAWSYDVEPVGGGITVTYGGSTIFSVDITHPGPGILQFRDQLYNAIADANNQPLNEELVVTLAAAAGAVGKLTIRYR